jgi:CheY-like chemotaxis protein
MVADVCSAPSQRRERSRRVLVVDDSPLMLAAVRLGLSGVAGWDVATADGGHDGIALAASYRPDAIVLDVVMPGLDGPGTLRGLRAQPGTRDTPVVFLTGGEDDRERLVALGAAGVIGKPFQPSKLAGQLCEVLGWPS